MNGAFPLRAAETGIHLVRKPEIPLLVQLDGVRGFQPVFADMDGDLFPELLLSADFTTSRYFVNNGDGTFTDFTAASGTALEANGMGNVVADFNNDGLFDWPRGYVTVLTQVAVNCNLTITAPRSGDLNADGVIGVVDLLGLLGLWGPVITPAGLAADLDNDGTVGVVDLLALLAGWG